MSGNNYESDPPRGDRIVIDDPHPTPPGVREAAIALLADFDATMKRADELGITLVEPPAKSIEALRSALQSERTAILDIQRPELVTEAVVRMKRGEEISADHIRAVVDAAEAAVANEASGSIRFEADMRAIKLWQEAAPAGEDRSLIWPDHADLVVWLLELVEARPTCPSPDEVDEMARRLRAIYVASPMISDAVEMLLQLANALISSSRRTVAAEAKLEAIANRAWIALGGEVHHLKMEREPAEQPAVVPICDEAERQTREMFDRISDGAPGYDSLRTVFGRPDVQEAVAKALAAERSADWQAATEAGREAFREEAGKLLAAAAAAPRGG